MAIGKDIVMVDLFSGIGGFSLGLKQAGFNITEHYFSEIEPHPIANYKYNFRDAEHIGSVTDVCGKRFNNGKETVITFGSPCQNLSLAGNRRGLAGEKSRLFFEAVRIVREARPSIFVWENVKGAFSSNNGADFWEVIKQFTDIGGYRLEWQLLNTSWLLPQNRERIFLVGHLAGRSIPKVFPFTGADFQDTGKNNGIQIYGHISSSQDGVVVDTDGIAPCLSAGHGNVPKIFNKSQSSRVYDARGIAPSLNSGSDNSGTQSPKIFAIRGRYKNGIKGQIKKVFEESSNGILNPLTREYMRDNILAQNGEYRRMTEIECERAQGFPDDWTKYGIDAKGKTIEIPATQRYKACGNSITVPFARMIGERLLMPDPAMPNGC